MSNFCSFQNKDAERKGKARREYTQNEKNCGMEANLGELNLVQRGGEHYWLVK